MDYKPAAQWLWTRGYNDTMKLSECRPACIAFDSMSGSRIRHRHARLGQKAYQHHVSCCLTLCSDCNNSFRFVTGFCDSSPKAQRQPSKCVPCWSTFWWPIINQSCDYSSAADLHVRSVISRAGHEALVISRLDSGLEVENRAAAKHETDTM